jgi:glycyl-tRNA synthetase
MAPMMDSAKISLSVPLYAVEFDPEDDRYLVVGGGGGEGRSGVGNKIVRRQFDLLQLRR